MPKSDKNTEMLSLLMETAKVIQDGVLWLGQDGHIIGVNDKLSNDLGYSKDDFKPKTIFEINPTMSLLSWRKLWKILLKDHEFSIDTEQITVDESIYPVQFRGVLLNIDQETVCMCIVENLMESNRFEDLLNLTSEIAQIGSWEWDLVQEEFLFTREMYRLLHLSPDSSLSKGYLKELISNMLSGNDALLFSKNMQTAVKSGQAFEMELALKINEVYQNFNLSVRPTWLEEKTIKLYGTLQNLVKISKRTDEMYFTKFCMDNARDMIFWLDPNGTITYVNQTTCNKLKYTAEEMIGQRVSFIAPQTKVDLEKHWKELKAAGSLEFESIHVTKEGEELPVSIIANYFNYRGKEFNCGFVRDLSDKVRRDELIAMAKQSLDQSIDMIFWLKPNGKFRYFNDAFRDKTGYSAKEINEMSITDFFPSTDMESFIAGWKKLQSGAKLSSMERDLHPKNQDIIPTEMTVHLVKVGTKEYSSNIVRDISNRKQEELESKNYIKQIKILQENTQAENIQLKEEINLEFNFNNIISRDPNYKKVLRQVEQVADTEATVLILGETGTGKELLARAVHELSERDEMPMVKVNCGALPENLIESELFGHEKGSFTGAYQRKIGKFERANKGTIFLDEIGELPLDLQSKLLRVLQEGEIERVGGQEVINIDVRVIAATNRNLEDQVAEGNFREDLYYRLNVFPIYNIPLRERREDIPVLVKHFTEKYSKRINKEISEISQVSLNKLVAYDFLGNVRELENMVERAVILAKNKVLSFDMGLTRKSSKAKSSKFNTMEEMQRLHIIEALRRAKGKVSGDFGAAQLLGMNDKTLTSRMKKLEIDKKDYLK